MDLKTLTEINAPSGHEQAIRRVLLDELKKLGFAPVLDRMGNVVVVKEGTGDAPRKRVMVSAHMDEVGLIVTSATEDGYLRIAAAGGVDPRVLVSKRVTVGDDKLPGVIGAVPIHLQSAAERKHVLSMEKEELLLIHGTEYKEMTREILYAAGLEAQIGARDKKIGIKPNLVAPSEAFLGATTHPEIVAGIIEYLQEAGFQNIIMLEGSWVGDKTRESMKVCGYEKLSEMYKVPFKDMQADPGELTECGGMELEICREAKSLDFLINVPVMKGHCQTKITCALKNMKGLLPNREKRHFHAMGLHKPIAHLAVGLHQDFILVDNICGDWDFEDGGNPVEMNRLIAGRDPVLVDAFVCHEMGYGVEEVPYIRMAEALGAGCADWTQARIRELNPPVSQVVKTGRRKVVEVADAVEEVESCSACYGYLIPALDPLKEEGVLEKLDTKICIGQGYRGKTGTLGIGSCTRGFASCLQGCPPTDEEIYQFLKKCIQEKEERI